MTASPDESAGEGEEFAAGDGEGDASLTAFLTTIPDAIREKILGSNPHVYVFEHGEGFRMTEWPSVLERVRNAPDVVAAEPFIMTQVGITRDGRFAQAGTLFGIDPEVAVTKRAHEFSGGQCQRLSIARALLMDAPILLTPGTSLHADVAAEIDARTPWARKHVTSVRQAYARAPFLAQYVPALEALLERRWERLVDLDIACVGLMAEWFGLQPRIERASALGIDGDRTGRLVNICRHFGATRYLSGDSAQAYLDVAAFEAQGIAVEWQRYTHPTYPQLHGPFVPYLSAIDLVLNCGSEAPLIAFGAIR